MTTSIGTRRARRLHSSDWLPLPVGLGAFGWHARRYREVVPAAT